MKRLLTCTILSLLFIGALPQKAKADRAAAGQLLWEWLSDSTYRFYFIYFNSCSGQPTDSSYTLCAYNSCNDSAFSVTMPMLIISTFPGGPTGNEPPCQPPVTTCSNPSAMYQGFKEHIFYTVLTLPRCSLWKFSVAVASRSASANLDAGQGGNNLYLEATMNNAQFSNNSSPYFTIKPTLFICANTPYQINSGAIDPARDSVITEIIQPLTRDTFCDSPVRTVDFANTVPALNTVTNPFQTNNTLMLNGNTGAILFGPTQLGVHSLTIKTKSYRNGVLKNSTMREMALQMIVCDIDSPQVTLDTPTLSGGYFADGYINLCPGQKLQFCWDVEGTDPSSIFAVSDNYRNVIPNATVTYTNRNTDSVRGCFSWQTDSATFGNFPLNITIKDSTCRPPGILLYYYHPLPIRVWGPALALKDTSVCQGQSVTLRAQNGDDYTWAVISGTAGNVSCYTCDTPIVKPSVSTMYRLVSAASAVCGNNVDTVTVSVWPTVKSNIKITGSDTAITEGETVYFNSLGVNCTTPGYQWRINGVNVPGATSGSFATSNLKDKDTVTCVLDCGDTCATPPMAVSNRVVVHVTPLPPPPTGIAVVAAHSFTLFPNPNTGKFTVSGLAETGPVEIVIANTIGQTLYKESWHNKTANIDRQITTDNLPESLYLLQIKTVTGTATMKFLLRR